MNKNSPSIHDRPLPTLFESTNEADELSWKDVIYHSKALKNAERHSDAVQAILTLQTATETWGDDVDLTAVTDVNEDHTDEQIGHNNSLKIPRGQNFWLRAAHTLVSTMLKT